jgi:hypothetical protein
VTRNIAFNPTQAPMFQRTSGDQSTRPDIPFGRWCQTTWKVFFSLISAKRFLSPVLSIVCNHGSSAVVGVGKLHMDIQTLKQPSISGIDGEKHYCTTVIIKSLIRPGEWTSDSTTMSNKYIKDSHGSLPLPYRQTSYSVTDRHHFKQSLNAWKVWRCNNYLLKQKINLEKV